MKYILAFIFCAIQIVNGLQLYSEEQESEVIQRLNDLHEQFSSKSKPEIIQEYIANQVGEVEKNFTSDLNNIRESVTDTAILDNIKKVEEAFIELVGKSKQAGDSIAILSPDLNKKSYPTLEMSNNTISEIRRHTKDLEQKVSADECKERTVADYPDLLKSYFNRTIECVEAVEPHFPATPFEIENILGDLKYYKSATMHFLENCVKSDNAECFEGSINLLTDKTSEIGKLADHYSDEPNLEIVALREYSRECMNKLLDYVQNTTVFLENRSESCV